MGGDPSDDHWGFDLWEEMPTRWEIHFVIARAALAGFDLIDAFRWLGFGIKELLNHPVPSVG